MISLCQKTLKLAEEKQNFSMWVRSQLLKEDQTNEMKLFQYTCLSCASWFERESKTVDKYFYCPNMMIGKCDNKATLRGHQL